MRAQGLPINFIVLAALAILILILAAGFIIGGGTSTGAALGPTQAKNACENSCKTLNNIGSTMPTSPGSSGAISNSTYCTLRQSVQGIGTNVTCSDARLGSSCNVMFQDGGSCGVKCTGDTAQCV